jgi:hypothetical protein
MSSKVKKAKFSLLSSIVIMSSLLLKIKRFLLSIPREIRPKARRVPKARKSKKRVEGMLE